VKTKTAFCWPKYSNERAKIFKREVKNIQKGGPKYSNERAKKLTRAVFLPSRLNILALSFEYFGQQKAVFVSLVWVGKSFGRSKGSRSQSRPNETAFLLEKYSNDRGKKLPPARRF